MFSLSDTQVSATGIRTRDSEHILIHELGHRIINELSTQLILNDKSTVKAISGRNSTHKPQVTETVQNTITIFKAD